MWCGSKGVNNGLLRHLKKHKLNTDDLKDLVYAIQQPIMVYKHGKEHPNIVVVTEMTVNGGKLSISLELDAEGNVVEISNISSVHSKEAIKELDRLSQLNEKELKEALRWVDKEKSFGLVNADPLYGVSHRNQPETYFYNKYNTKF